MHIEKRSQKRKQQVFFSVCSKGQKARFEFNQTAKLANLSEQRDKVRSISAPAASLHNSCCISTLKYGMQRNALGSGHMRSQYTALEHHSLPACIASLASPCRLFTCIMCYQSIPRSHCRLWASKCGAKVPARSCAGKVRKQKGVSRRSISQRVGNKISRHEEVFTYRYRRLTVFLQWGLVRPWGSSEEAGSWGLFDSGFFTTVDILS